MKIIKTNINDLILIEPNIYSDERGYFFPSFKKETFSKQINNADFLQDNESYSSFGVLRGLHFQRPPFEQAKLVRVIHGEVLDVAVDLRPDSATYLKYYSVKLNSDNKIQMYIPRGFAHGFVVLSKDAIFSYKVDNIYSPDHEDGILWNDPELNIDWILDSKSIKVSEKDKKLSNLKFNKL